MNVSCDLRSKVNQVQRIIFKQVVVLLLSIVSVLVVVGLTQSASAAPQVVESAWSHPSALGVTSSPVMTYQVFLPLIFRQGKASTFGVQLYGNLSSATGFTRAVELNAGWVRVPIHWAQIEPVNTIPANYNWTGPDASVQAAQNANIKVIFTLDANPEWAAVKVNGPVTSTADLQEFIGAAVARYPTITYWEIYNEPDSVSRFGTHGDVYGELLTDLYPVIKSANPSAKVVLGGLALDWFLDEGGNFDRNFLTDTLANCAGTCFDVANFHYYPAFRGRWENYGPDIIGKANYVRQTLAATNFTRPVVVTEMGWPAATNWGSTELAARYVPKAYARSMAADLGATIWFALLDADSSNPGLLDSTTTPGTFIPRPAYQAYQALTTLMNGAQYAGAVLTIDPIEGYRFTVNGRRLDVYWYDCPQVRYPLSDGPHDCTSTKTQVIDAPRVGVVDKYGVKVIKNDIDDGMVDGKVTLSIDTNPVYVDYNP